MEYWPGEQIDGQAWVAPAAPQHPAVSSLHVGAAVEELNVPAPHREHEAAPPAENEPAPHSFGHAVVAPAGPEQPAVIGEHEATPPGENEPAAHVLGHAVVAPGGPKQPALTGEQAAAPPTE